MEAIREIIHVDGNLINFSVPDQFAGQDVEVIVLPLKSSEKQKKKRKLGAYKSRIKISKGFDDQLPESFWFGGE